MYYRDHGPPHFHARYGSHKALIAIQPLALIEGDMPPRALGLVMEWARQHRAQLQSNWTAAERLEPLVAIEPLE